MKKLMINIKWEEVECHICHTKKSPEPLKLRGKPLTDGQFGYAVHPTICECGLVFLSPRWSKKDFDVFYKSYYNDLYRLETKPDIGINGVTKNMEVVWNRISHHLEGEIKTILDVGCGSGYGLKYLKEKIPESSIYGIEFSPESIKTLQSKEIGAELITTDFDSNWTDRYIKKIDLIILRHTIEHMLDPVNTLKKIRRALTDEGSIYFATPDMMNPRTVLRDYENWWEYWFRPVHPYYFSKETLFSTLKLGGLYPYIYEEENEEIWCLANPQDRGKISVNVNGLYNRQINVIKRLLS